MIPSTQNTEHDETAENLLSTGNLDDDDDDDDDDEEENLDNKIEEDNLADEIEAESFTTQQLFSFAWQIAKGMVTIITCCYM